MNFAAHADYYSHFPVVWKRNLINCPIAIPKLLMKYNSVDLLAVACACHEAPEKQNLLWTLFGCDVTVGELNMHGGKGVPASQTLPFDAPKASVQLSKVCFICDDRISICKYFCHLMPPLICFPFHIKCQLCQFSCPHLLQSFSCPHLLQSFSCPHLLQSFSCPHL